MAVLHLHCCAGFSLVLTCRGLLSGRSVQASHCSGFSCWGTGLQDATASIVVAHGRHCSAACGIFPGQGLNLHWQVGSLPPGKPILHGSSGKLI